MNRSIHYCLGLLALAILAGPAIAAAPPSTTHQEQMTACCPIVELRQYTLFPGKRDELIELFENEFVETQEAVGMRLAGQFRDANHADRFVWIRGFDSMPAREAVLTRFYFGPVWQAHRDKANATLADNDDVLLLRPAFPGSGFALDPSARPAKGAAAGHAGVIVATIYYFDAHETADTITGFARSLVPLAEQAGARVLAQYVSEKSKNTFPRLPVRENDNVFVWFGAFASLQAYENWQHTLTRHPRWRDQLAPSMRTALLRTPEVLVLHPTARSLVR